MVVSTALQLRSTCQAPAVSKSKTGRYLISKVEQIFFYLTWFCNWLLIQLDFGSNLSCWRSSSMYLGVLCFFAVKKQAWKQRERANQYVQASHSQRSWQENMPFFKDKHGETTGVCYHEGKSASPHQFIVPNWGCRVVPHQDSVCSGGDPLLAHGLGPLRRHLLEI